MSFDLLPYEEMTNPELFVKNIEKSLWFGISLPKVEAPHPDFQKDHARTHFVMITLLCFTIQM